MKFAMANDNNTLYVALWRAKYSHQLKLILSDNTEPMEQQLNVK